MVRWPATHWSGGKGAKVWCAKRITDKKCSYLTIHKTLIRV